MIQSVAVCCSVLQCVAVCCSVLQCVAVSHMAHEQVKPDTPDTGRDLTCLCAI